MDIVRLLIRKHVINCTVLGVWKEQAGKFYAVNDTDMWDRTAVDLTVSCGTQAPTMNVFVRELPAKPEVVESQVVDVQEGLSDE